MLLVRQPLIRHGGRGCLCNGVSSLQRFPVQQFCDMPVCCTCWDKSGSLLRGASPRYSVPMNTVRSTAEMLALYKGCDAAVLVEVVEHLDPGPLAALGPSVFGRLRPKMVVVTTPNAGYNAVMAAAGVWLLHNELRNRDHRFEWCVVDTVRTWMTTA